MAAVRFNNIVIPGPIEAMPWPHLSLSLGLYEWEATKIFKSTQINNYLQFVYRYLALDQSVSFC